MHNTAVWDGASPVLGCLCGFEAPAAQTTSRAGGGRGLGVAHSTRYMSQKALGLSALASGTMRSIRRLCSLHLVAPSRACSSTAPGTC